MAALETSGYLLGYFKLPLKRKKNLAFSVQHFDNDSEKYIGAMLIRFGENTKLGGMFM